MLTCTSPFWRWSSLVWTLVLASSAASSEAVKRLPADTEFIASLNVRQVLDAPLLKKSAPAQQFLDRWRLALKGNERQLKEYYQNKELKEWGLTEEGFLEWARQFKARCDAVGLDPFKDVDRLTLGCSLGKDLLTVVVEGTFQLATFRDAARADARKDPASRLTPLAGVDVWEWADPSRVGGRQYLALLSPKCLVLGNSKEAMVEILERASGKRKGELSPAMQALFREAEGEQIAVVAKIDQAVVRGLAAEMKKHRPPPIDVLGRWAHDLMTTLLEKFGGDVTVASLGLTFGEEEFHYQIGLDFKNQRVARELRSWIGSSNFLAGLFLRSVEGDTARMLASIIRKVRVTGKDSAVFIRVPVPYAFVQQILNGPWL